MTEGRLFSMRALEKENYKKRIKGLEKALHIIAYEIAGSSNAKKIAKQALDLSSGLKSGPSALPKFCLHGVVKGEPCTKCGKEYKARSLKEEPIKSNEPKFCICCEEITKENAYLHRNCGK